MGGVLFYLSQYQVKEILVYASSTSSGNRIVAKTSALNIVSYPASFLYIDVKRFLTDFDPSNPHIY